MQYQERSSNCPLARACTIDVCPTGSVLVVEPDPTVRIRALETGELFAIGGVAMLECGQDLSDSERAQALAQLRPQPEDNA